MINYKLKLYKYEHKMKNMLNNLKGSSSILNETKNLGNNHFVRKSMGDNYIHVKIDADGIGEMWFSTYETAIYHNITQSMYNPNDLEKNYLTYIYPLLTCLFYCTQLNDILIIGLGGGNIPLFIKNKYPNSNIEIVEIDENVAIMAKYISTDIDKLKIHIDDGNEFLKKNTKKYNLIIIDLDGEKSILKFNFDKIFDALTNDGILAINSYTEFPPTQLPDKLKNYACIKHYKLYSNNIFICSKNILMYETMNKQMDNNMIKNIFTKYSKNFIDTVNELQFNMLKSISSN